MIPGLEIQVKHKKYRLKKEYYGRAIYLGEITEDNSEKIENSPLFELVPETETLEQYVKRVEDLIITDPITGERTRVISGCF
jgi:hypothetical protein